MDLLNGIGKKITAAAKTITRKSEDLVEITKLNLDIGSEEEKVKRVLYELGSELYKSYTNGKALGDFYDVRCSEVKQIEENINALKERVLLFSTVPGT